MAWEDLLKLDSEKTEPQSLQEFETVKAAGSLIGQVCEQFGQSMSEDASPTDDDALHTPVQCADGYVRRSPVQPYGTAEDFNRRRVRRILMFLLGAAFLVLLIYALMRAGLLVFRLR